jgi:hypothetical protein
VTPPPLSKPLATVAVLAVATRTSSTEAARRFSIFFRSETPSAANESPRPGWSLGWGDLPGVPSAPHLGLRSLRLQRELLATLGVQPGRRRGVRSFCAWRRELRRLRYAGRGTATSSLDPPQKAQKRPPSGMAVMPCLGREGIPAAAALREETHHRHPSLRFEWTTRYPSSKIPAPPTHQQAQQGRLIPRARPSLPAYNFSRYLPPRARVPASRFCTRHRTASCWRDRRRWNQRLRAAVFSPELLEGPCRCRRMSKWLIAKPVSPGSRR